MRDFLHVSREEARIVPVVRAEGARLVAGQAADNGGCRAAKDKEKSPSDSAACGPAFMQDGLEDRAAVAVLLGPFADVEPLLAGDFDEPKVQPIIDRETKIGVGDYKAHRHESAGSGLDGLCREAAALPTGFQF